MLYSRMEEKSDKLSRRPGIHII